MMSKSLLILFFVVAMIAVMFIWWATLSPATVSPIPAPSQVDNSREMVSQSPTEPVGTVIKDNHPKKRNFTNFFHE